MNENDLRDVFAMFAMVGLCMREEVAVFGSVPDMAYQVADAMLEARKPKEESGITAVKRVRKTSEKRDA
jgi:hypothetical protein